MARDFISTIPETANLKDILSKTLKYIQTFGADFKAPLFQLMGIEKQLAKGHFHLAVLGQFKHGKSTLLNTLLGHKILPTAVIPLTAIPTFIRYGQILTASVFFQSTNKPQINAAGRTDDIKALLNRYVTEEGNLKNIKGEQNNGILQNRY